MKLTHLAALAAILLISLPAKATDSSVTISPGDSSTVKTLPSPKEANNAVSYVINPEARRQTFDGWGVSLCWWANMCGKWSDEKIDEIVEWLVSPEGLNYRFFRYNIGGGDDPQNRNCTPHHFGKGKGLRAEMEGFKDSSDGPYIWSRDAAQRKIMLKIKERRPDAVFEAFSNSAPYYMTYSGCCGGNDPSSADNLKPEYYEEFAHYLVDVCKHYKDEYGIEFITLDPFNEPMTNYWGRDGGQEGCHFDVESQIAFIKALHPILKESGLATVISASDETSVAQAVNDFLAYRNAGVIDLVGQFNTHTYTADNKARAKLSALCEEEGMRLWMSEVGAGGNGLAGNLSLAHKLINDIKYIMPSAWIDWQYIEENNDQWCLVRGDFNSASYKKVKNYYVRSHFSRFIKEGHTFLSVMNGYTLAALNKDNNELVIVALNEENSAVEHAIDLSMFGSVETPTTAVITDATRDMGSIRGVSLEDGILSFKLPAMSVVTIVLPVTLPESMAATVEDGGRYMMHPRLAIDVALGATDGKVTLEDMTMGGSQVWTASASGKGFRFINDNGDYLTEGSGYDLTTKTKKGTGQTFLIEPVDQYYNKISNSSGSKSMDLYGQRYAVGTAVGMYKYADGDAPVHRQWELFRLPGELSSSGIDCLLWDREGSEAKESLDGGKEGFGEGNDEESSLSASRPRFRIEEDGVAVAVPTGGSRVAIYDATGRAVFSRESAAGQISIPLPAGLYLLRLGSGPAVKIAIK